MIFEMMPPKEIAFLVLGIVACIICVSSYQIKNRRLYLLFQLAMAAVLVVQYAVINVWAAVVLNSVSVIRAIAFYFAKTKKQRVWFGVTLSLMNVGATALTIFVFDKSFWYMSLLIGLAQIAGTLAMIFDDVDGIKITQLAVVSPAWLAYSIFYTVQGHNNVGGIVQESFNILSIIIYYLFTRKKLIELEKKKQEENKNGQE